MKKIIFTIIIYLIGLWNINSQASCDEIMQTVKDKGNLQGSYCCFNSEFLTGVKFYSLDIEYQTYYFALVQFNLGKWYIYQVSSNTKSNFSLYAFGDQAGEAFHKYIHSYRNSLGCAPDIR